MARLASPAARLRGARLVRALGVGRPWCVAVVLGCGLDPDRGLLPAPEPGPAQLAARRCVVAQPPDPAWRSVLGPSRPGFVAIVRESGGASMGVRCVRGPGTCRLQQRRAG